VRSSRSMRWRGSGFGHSPTCRSDEQFGAKVRASFLASDRTYGARGVWHDMLAEGVSCGPHRIERLMRQQALKAPFATASTAARSG
jgi:transposase InsO family protein